MLRPLRADGGAELRLVGALSREKRTSRLMRNMHFAGSKPSTASSTAPTPAITAPTRSANSGAAPGIAAGAEPGLVVVVGQFLEEADQSGMCSSQTSPLSQVYALPTSTGKAQAKALQESRQVGELRVARRRQHSIEILAVEFCISCDFAHATLLSHIAQCKKEAIHIAFCQRCVQIRGCLRWVGQCLAQSSSYRAVVVFISTSADSLASDLEPLDVSAIVYACPSAEQRTIVSPCLP